MEVAARSPGRLQQPSAAPPAEGADLELLRSFEERILSRVPREENGRIVAPTPLVEMTQAVEECAKQEYGLDISGRGVQVFGKLEASILGGSVKSRPAVRIVHDAIRSGKLRRGMVVFEATSGNFGISLGLAGRLGVSVVVLVSRKLQGGVLEELEQSGVKTVDLDVDICPAPGVRMDPNTAVSRAVAATVRERLSELGLPTEAFDKARPKVEDLLARQDVIGLAKLLAEAYAGFCPEQYENYENVQSHVSVTGPELDQQLRERGTSLGEAAIVCAFGTGGTSGGLSRYVEARYGGRKSVHVVFPAEGQEVAGIRTKGTAAGLRFYEPERYAGEHEVDFDQARRLFAFMVKRGFDVGESSALALYAAIRMAASGQGGRFVVMLADGAKKYARAASSPPEQRGIEVTLEDARSSPGSIDQVVWTHSMYVPTEEGRRVIASVLGVPESSVTVADPRDVARVVSGQPIPEGLRASLGGGQKRVVLVCMSGNTSLRSARALEAGGIKSQSLQGGMTRISQAEKRPLPSLVRAV
ncbi:MAG: pyridoxal-phosphate dependent enzyme [Nitrososphaerota archaeon]|nr:pyridoxal-phosphate dependent enzyme [Nitrososphaerota archaeon]MDG6978701.1 pyridoxal-phosphate dependent enzyme [Nitrososphaerota archaeon]